MEETNKDLLEKSEIQTQKILQTEKPSVDKKDDADDLVACSSLKVENEGKTTCEKGTQTTGSVCLKDQIRRYNRRRLRLHSNHQARQSDPFRVLLKVISDSGICPQKEELASNENDSADGTVSEPQLNKKNIFIDLPGMRSECVRDLVRKFDSFGKTVQYFFIEDLCKIGVTGVIYYESAEAAKNATEEMNGKLVANSLLEVKRF